MNSRRVLVPSGLLLACVLTAGCATHADQLVALRSDYYAGELAAAESKIDTAVKRHPRDADVLKLERATVLLGEGKPREAEQLLREVRDRFDHLEQKDLAEGALAMLTDDQRLAYAGEDYEKVLIRAFLALANLLGDGQDAGAYALQVAAKQQQLVQAGAGPDGNNPKQNYKPVAVGAYLHAALREATHQNYDDATRSIEQVCAWAPDFQAGKQDLERLRQGRHSAPGNGVVYVFTLVGRGPYKEERWEIATQASLLVADRIITALGKYSLPPTLAPVKVPRVVVPVNGVQAVRVQADGRVGGQTETLTDVGRLAREQGDALLPYVMARAVARRVVKKGVVYGAKELMKVEPTGVGNLALDVAGVVWEATESADTRCWGLLPEKIQVLRLELPAGKHQLALQPVNGQGVPQGAPQPVTVELGDGRNSYVVASFPTGRLAGRVVCSREPQ
jgi:uncharacterized protein